MENTANPWKTLGSELKYENPWIRVVENKVINPSGKEGIYGVVHFKNRAVAVIPYEKGKIWLVGQYRYTLSSYEWEVPEGGCPENEDLLNCARRELKEETGLEAEDYRLILEMQLSNSVSDEVSYTYLARGLHHGIAEPEETEQLSVKQVELGEALDMIERGEIKDALSVASLLRIFQMQIRGELE